MSAAARTASSVGLDSHLPLWHSRFVYPVGEPMTLPMRWNDVRPALQLVAEATRWSVEFAAQLTSEPHGGGTAAKSDASPVTAADLAVQALLVHGLREHYGDMPVVGEESTAVFCEGGADERRERLEEHDGQYSLRASVHKFVRQARPGLTPTQIDEAIDAGCADGTSREQWIIDPIDGTRGYLGGQQYCVCLAFVRDQVPLFGAAGCPRLGTRGSIIGAVPGGGAWCWSGLDLSEAPAQMVTSRSAREAGGALVVCESPQASARARSRMRRLAESLNRQVIVRPMESQCKFVLVANGQADLAIRFASNDPARNRDMVWDYAGAVVFAEEAGARMTDCDGAPLRFGRGRAIERNRGILCAASWLHADAVRACRSVDHEFDALPMRAATEPPAGEGRA